MNLTYKVIENGYEIYKENQTIPWIGQGGFYGDYIPYPIKTDGVIDYAKSAQAHIDAIIQAEEQAVDEATQVQNQLDRIEKCTTQLLSDIKAEAVDEYTLELMNEGVI